MAETYILTHGASTGLYSGLVGDSESSRQEKVRRGNEWGKKEFCDILWTIRLAIRRHASSNSIIKLHFILSHNIFKRHLLQRYLFFLVLILGDSDGYITILGFKIRIPYLRICHYLYTM